MKKGRRKRVLLFVMGGEMKEKKFGTYGFKSK